MFCLERASKQASSKEIWWNVFFLRNYVLQLHAAAV